MIQEKRNQAANRSTKQSQKNVECGIFKRRPLTSFFIGLLLGFLLYQIVLKPIFFG